MTKTIAWLGDDGFGCLGICELNVQSNGLCCSSWRLGLWQFLNLSRWWIWPDHDRRCPCNQFWWLWV